MCNWVLAFNECSRNMFLKVSCKNIVYLLVVVITFFPLFLEHMVLLMIWTQARPIYEHLILYYLHGLCSMNKLTEWLKSDRTHFDWSQFVLRSVILYRLTLQELLSSPRLRGLNTVKADFSHCKKTTTTKKIKCIFIYFFHCTS